MHVGAAELVARLRAEGLRVTPAREAICAVLAADHDDHLDVATVHARAEEVAGRPIDQSTVYRTLDALEETGVVGHVHLADRRLVVHLADDEHHHLTCEDCGRTVDVPEGELAEALAPVAARYGYTVGSVHFAVVGRCAACAGVRPDDA